MTGSPVPLIPPNPQAAESSRRRIEPLRAMRLAALVLIAAGCLAAAAAAFAESYHAQYVWALHHRETGAWARWWPLQVDAFVAIPELVLLVALVDRWRTRDRAGAWLVALAGITASLYFNVGHVDAPADRLTFAVPPLAAATSLALALAVLKRVVNPPADTPVPVAHLTARAAAQFVDELDRGEVPGIRRLKRALSIGQPRAREVREQLGLFVNNGHGRRDG